MSEARGCLWLLAASVIAGLLSVLVVAPMTRDMTGSLPPMVALGVNTGIAIVGVLLLIALMLGLDYIARGRRRRGDGP